MEIRKDSIIDLFRSYNAILEGHFLLSSGLHSDKYLQCALVLQYPNIAEKLAVLLFNEIKQDVNNWHKINLVVSPALGGVVFGQEVARVFRTFSCNEIRAIWTERDNNGSMILRRNFCISPTDNIVIIEDVVTTGKSTNEVIGVVEEFCGNIICVASIFNRMLKENAFNYPYKYLAKVEVNNYKQSDCPMCKQGLPIVKPGSRKNAV